MRHSALSLRLISWNVQGRLRVIPAQLAALAGRSPDVVALQEVREATLPLLTDGLQALGLTYVCESVTLALREGRRYGLLLASRFPLTVLPLLEMPYRERVLAAQLATRWGLLELHSTHVPQSGKHGWLKVDTCEALYAHLACAAPGPRILCGDLNSPLHELPDGSVVTYAQQIQPDGSITLRERWCDSTGREDSGARWDSAERLLLTGLARYDLPDVFRAIHGYGFQAASWYWHAPGVKVGRRFDHIFASQALGARECGYLDWWAQDLSDHAPIEALFVPQQPWATAAD